jgi:hypothetical protein
MPPNKSTQARWSVGDSISEGRCHPRSQLHSCDPHQAPLLSKFHSIHKPVPGWPVPVKQWDVYVDGFIGLVQGGPHNRRYVKRALLTTLDSVFQRISPNHGPFRQEPVSIKKMLKGATMCATHKVILGWSVGTLRMTIELPVHRVAHLFEILDNLPLHQGCTSVVKWQKLLGGLWCAAKRAGKAVRNLLQTPPDATSSRHFEGLPVDGSGFGQPPYEVGKSSSGRHCIYLGSTRRCGDRHGLSLFCATGGWHHRAPAVTSHFPREDSEVTGLVRQPRRNNYQQRARAGRWCCPTGCLGPDLRCPREGRIQIIGQCGNVVAKEMSHLIIGPDIPSAPNSSLASTSLPLCTSP